MSPEGLDQLAGGLGHLTQLKKLMWADFVLTVTPMGRIAPVLGTLTQLEELFLSHNFLGYEAVSLLVLELPKLINLKKLDLSKNPLGNHGVKAILNACANLPPQFTSLGLRETQTDKKAEEEFAQLFGSCRPDVNLFLGRTSD